MQDEIIDIIIRQARRNASDADKSRLAEWLEESEENRRFYSMFIANFSLHDTITSPNLRDDMESMVARLDARIDAHEAQKRSFPLFRTLTWACGAALAVVLSFLLIKGVWSSKPVQEPMETISNLTAETIYFSLDDGTKVYLHPGSYIVYNVSTLADRREVTLHGDAYFDVVHNEAKPFIVRTDNIGIRVTGTAFSVSASAEQSQVVLERGSVRILSPEGLPTVTLSPNQKATFKQLTGDLRVEPVYATAFVTDKYNLTSMSDVTLAQISANLANIFKRKIRFEGGDDEKRYNLAFLRTDSLEDVLSIVEYMTGATFTFQ